MSMHHYICGLFSYRETALNSPGLSVSLPANCRWELVYPKSWLSCPRLQWLSSVHLVKRPRSRRAQNGLHHGVHPNCGSSDPTSCSSGKQTFEKVLGALLRLRTSTVWWHDRTPSGPRNCMVQKEHVRTPLILSLNIMTKNMTAKCPRATSFY